MFQPGHRPCILVLGDLILDEYQRGTAQRLSPEAPVPVLEATPATSVLGGAANVAANLAALGAEVRLCGVRGNDRQGEQLTALLAHAAIDCRGVVVMPERPTTHKLRVVAHGQQLVRIDREECGALPASVEAALLEAVEAQLPDVVGVVLSDYAKGVLGGSLCEQVIARARARGLHVTVDPKGTCYARYAHANLITPNLVELARGTGRGVQTEAERWEAARALLAETHAEAILVTCGKEGMRLLQSEAPPLSVRAEARQVFDVTGAGDTVIAVASLALFAGVPLSNAARVANLAAGIVVGKPGTATVSRAELAEAAGRRMSTSAGKIVSRAQAAAHIREAQAMGARVVFTNGCFDLLHAGHVTYLEAAREQGDVLVVAVNSDASVRRLKGAARPIVAEADRMALVAGLAAVDWVVRFEEDTPAALIELLAPDVLVKGSDYRPEQVVGKEQVEASGGRVELIPVLQGRSTSSIIATILTRLGREERA